eukprot:CAMPEP_0171135088 /NCGR_PEP_ID=MMETSP0766_2-20121228/129220_1 /TAXON_ID=439317 /ORGANISM="Gambierdiscus australes, Strain CAWD 149" /LENGTH=60 /DNA_ID=CAMNT_0011598573 /DNA_START=16 /DNA_END=195 /DNA_ORIENTATION=-
MTSMLLQQAQLQQDAFNMFKQALDAQVAQKQHTTGGRNALPRETAEVNESAAQPDKSQQD